jgi:hypothetical protein
VLHPRALCGVKRFGCPQSVPIVLSHQKSRARSIRYKSRGEPKYGRILKGVGVGVHCLLHNARAVLTGRTIPEYRHFTESQRSVTPQPVYYVVAIRYRNCLLLLTLVLAEYQLHSQGNVVRATYILSRKTSAQVLGRMWS